MGSSLCKCSIFLGFFMSKKLERLRSELLSEDKITNLLGFLTKQNPGGWSIYRVKNLSPQIRILVLFQCSNICQIELVCTALKNGVLFFAASKI